jgi:hypothetical protein
VHDFDFLQGSWSVQHRRLKQRLAHSDEWAIDSRGGMRKFLPAWHDSGCTRWFVTSVRRGWLRRYDHFGSLPRRVEPTLQRKLISVSQIWLQRACHRLVLLDHERVVSVRQSATKNQPRVEVRRCVVGSS